MEFETVPRHKYEQVLDTDLPDRLDDTVQIDRRGYSPEVAEELGSDYLEGGISIVSEKQLDAECLSQGYSTTDQLMDGIEETDNLLDYVETIGPATFDIDVTPEAGGYAFELALDPRRSATGTEEAFRLADDVERMDYTDLQEEGRSQELLQQHDQVDTERALPGTPGEPPSLTVEGFTVQQDDTTAVFLYKDGDHVLLQYADDPLLDAAGMNPADWVQEEDVDILGTAHTSGFLSIDDEHLDERLEDRSEAFLDTFRKQTEDQEAYRTLEEMYALDESIPDEWKALRVLKEERDLKLETDADLVKASCLEGNDKIGRILINMLAGAETQDRVETRVFTGEGRSVEELTAAYRQWKHRHHVGFRDDRAKKTANEILEDRPYNADSIEQFCRNRSFEEDDGYFITAMAEQAPEDEVWLPEMEAVDMVGYMQESSRIVVNGDVGDWPAMKMTGGELVILGDTNGGRGAWVGDDMEGGTAYIQGNGRKSPNRPGGTITGSLPDDLNDEEEESSVLGGFWPFTR
ncbi:MAG: hypothetical protein SVU32_07750 [Candidatus Nanohaloarchaea archaeon]|nr:hypothetical protein [Candidatus Nanohaloarchaea archaeon]